MRAPQILALMIALYPLAYASGQTRFGTIYTFGDGYAVGLTAHNGVLYGATESSINCGTVFQLQPPGAGSGAWTETVLYNFASTNGDACEPLLAPIVGANGALYGLSNFGGAYGSGAAYELQPPSSPGGVWTEAAIYSFNDRLGGGPLTGLPTSLVLGPRGSLYITTAGGGIYFSGTLLQLQSPAAPGGAWTGEVLYSFTGGAGGNIPISLTQGPHGVLYGTTELGGTAHYAAGTVFELFPPAAPGGAWTESVLYSFKGNYDGSTPIGVILGPSGTLYGATHGTNFSSPTGLGTVFQLTPSSPGASWTKTILQYFGTKHQCGPDSPLILHNGKLYGATCAAGGDLVFELQPPSAPGGAWTTIYLHRFTTGQVPTPYGAMVLDGKGTLYGATYNPASLQSPGTIYSITP